MCIRDRLRKAKNLKTNSWSYSSLDFAILNCVRFLNTSDWLILKSISFNFGLTPLYIAFLISWGVNFDPPELSRLKSSYFIECLLYTSDAADEEDSVDLGGRR